MVKGCITCGRNSDGNCELTSTCDNLDLWVPRDGSDGDVKNCSTCRHQLLAGNASPCLECDGNDSCWTPKENVVDKPNHYAAQYPFEVKEVIKDTLNTYGFDLTPYQCYCLGCEIKYRLRAGFKDDIEQEIGKALKYKEFRDEC